MRLYALKVADSLATDVEEAVTDRITLRITLIKSPTFRQGLWLDSNHLFAILIARVGALVAERYAIFEFWIIERFAFFRAFVANV